jgi:putative transposase
MPYLLREMMRFAAQRLMELEIEPLCRAAHGDRSAKRLIVCNGYHERDGETRVGTVDLRIQSSDEGRIFRPS